MEIGLIENYILPSGSGQNGSLFGDSLPSP
jgi:hypothetical protein